MYIRSRRDFLGYAPFGDSLGRSGRNGEFGEMNALAAGSSNYQALVCVFMLGGNDGHNTVVDHHGKQNYSLYSQARGPLAIPQASLLPIANGSDTYGLHPSLVEIQGLYNQGKAAVLTNVGMLVQPITRSMYLTNNGALVPSALFSHSDQSSQWQTGIPSGTGSSGWGGRITDLMQAQNAGAIFPPMTATTGCQLFCTGVQTFPASVPPTGMSTLNVNLTSTQTGSAMQQLLTFDNGVQLVQAANGIMTRGNAWRNTLAVPGRGYSCGPSSPLATYWRPSYRPLPRSWPCAASWASRGRSFSACWTLRYPLRADRNADTALAATEPGGSGVLPGHNRAGGRRSGHNLHGVRVRAHPHA